MANRDDAQVVSDKRDRRRKRKARPEPLPSVKAAEAKTLATIKRRPISPGVLVEPAEGDGWEITSPHSDLDLWEKQIALALGTRSLAVIRVFMRDLRKLCATAWDADTGLWAPDEDELNTALAMVADWQPRNVAEAALAAQLVSVHWMQMRLSAQALNNGGMIMERDAALAAKLSRTFAVLLDSFRMMRGRGRRSSKQTITVNKTLHQEVRYYDHRGSQNHGDQSDATDGSTINGTCQPAGSAALPSPAEARGRVVPFPSGEGADSLPNARRKGGGSKGRG